MKIEVSNGEILDKLSILQIKKELIKDKDKLLNVEKEHSYISEASQYILKEEVIASLFQSLIQVNRELWDIEDKIRLKEKALTFDEEFISLARSVYITNDKRADIKKQINLLSNSEFVEEKSYEKY
jgi:hypothetical protein